MSLHDLSEIAVIAQAIVAIVAAIVAIIAACAIFCQIRAQRLENRKWQTLNICAQYEFNATIADAAEKIHKIFHQNEPTKAEEYVSLRRPAIVVLNYLDGIAIGVGQDLYIEELARDHLKQIVRFHIDKLFDQILCKKLGLDKKDYQFLEEMDKKWSQDKPYYKD